MRPAHSSKRSAKPGPDNVRPPDFRAALGASRSYRVESKPHGPFGVAALLDELQTRLVSRGGRPADPGATIRRLVPMKKDVWRNLKAQAAYLSSHGKRVSPAQLAAMLIERGMSAGKKKAGDSAKHHQVSELTTS